MSLIVARNLKRAKAQDAAKLRVGQRVRAKDPTYEYSEGKSLGAGMFTVKEVNNNGDVKLDDCGDVWISPSALVEANDACEDSAAKFRIGQEVIVKTKYAEPYKARIVGLWDMSQNGPYNEQGYLIKNIKGGGVESMPEHALSLVTAKDSAELNNDAGDADEDNYYLTAKKSIEDAGRLLASAVISLSRSKAPNAKEVHAELTRMSDMFERIRKRI